PTVPPPIGTTIGLDDTLLPANPNTRVAVSPPVAPDGNETFAWTVDTLARFTIEGGFEGPPRTIAESALIGPTVSFTAWGPVYMVGLPAGSVTIAVTDTAPSTNADALIAPTATGPPASETVVGSEVAVRMPSVMLA